MPAERWAAVLGKPITHSLSPVLHRAAYAALGLPWTYDAREVDSSSLASALSLARGSATFAGYSLTMPLKASAVPLLDRVVGALPVVNTVVPVGSSLVGYNTDVDGITAALSLLAPFPGPALVLGAGGTAVAAVAALAAAGHPVTVASRRTVSLPGMSSWVAFDKVRAASFSVVVSTTPAGATDALAVSGWPGEVGLVDVVYAPWPTALAAAARLAGAPVVGGREVLLGQAVEQVRLMTGLVPPVSAMRAALEFSPGPVEGG